MAIHVKQFAPPFCTTIVTDMTNAGKRGKVCRVIYAQSSHGHQLDDPGGLFLRCNLFEGMPDDTEWAIRRSGTVLPDASIESFAAFLETAPAGSLTINEKTIRGIDAPLPPLVAGADGKWFASIDHTGLHMRDLSDPMNEPTLILRDQKASRAYALARKVWPQVEAAPTFGAAWTTLQSAGVSLHYFCAVD